MDNSLILRELINALHTNVSQFEKEINVGSSAISKAIKRNSKLTMDVITKILSRYPDVNKEWLLTGEGSMFTSGEVKLAKPKQVIPLGKHAHTNLKLEEYAAAYGDWLGVPMYNTPVTASFIETYRDEAMYQPTYYLHDPRFKDCKFGAIITGDSMHSEIRHGDHVICQEIMDWRFVVYGDIYYIVSTNGLETCKYLNADPSDKDNFLLVPRNDSISPSPIPKNMILKMYKVRGVVRGY
jgi:phage repressor protein C with HTH and peptisase S24 domain